MLIKIKNAGANIELLAHMWANNLNILDIPLTVQSTLTVIEDYFNRAHGALTRTAGA